MASDRDAADDEVGHVTGRRGLSGPPSPIFESGSGIRTTLGVAIYRASSG